MHGKRFFSCCFQNSLFVFDFWQLGYNILQCRLLCCFCSPLDLWIWCLLPFPNLESLHFTSVAQSCPTLCDPMNRSKPGLPVHHQLLESTQIHVHWLGDGIQPSHPLLSPSPAFNLSQNQGLFQWVSSSHQVAKVLEFQLQQQSFQWTPRTDFL